MDTYLIPNNHKRVSIDTILDSSVMQELVEPHLDIVEGAAVIDSVGQDTNI